MVICCFRPKPGKEDELLGVVMDHLKVLRQEGLATERPTLAMRAQDGTILEVFEWVSEEAAREAHSNPAVLELWGRYGAASDLTSFGQLAEAKEFFPHFEPIDM
jgi:hypothetical protein